MQKADEQKGHPLTQYVDVNFDHAHLIELLPPMQVNPGEPDSAWRVKVTSTGGVKSWYVIAAGTATEQQAKNELLHLQTALGVVPSKVSVLAGLPDPTIPKG